MRRLLLRSGASDGHDVSVPGSPPWSLDCAPNDQPVAGRLRLEGWRRGPAVARRVPAASIEEDLITAFSFPRSVRAFRVADQRAVDWNQDEHLHAFVEQQRKSPVYAVATGSAGGGALHGIPVAVKDVIRVDGWPTRAGSLLPPEALSGPQASLVDRLISEGALIVGKTVTAEFALSEPGPTVNPRDPDRTPGGSSSGSAAAVGAGLVPVAIGTQTIGSVIRPAAFCGVVGFRPTWGLLPTDGVIPNAPSFDTIGWFTADVASSTTVASALIADLEAPVLGRTPVLGVPTEDYLRHANPDALAAYRTQLTALNSAGVTTVPVPLPALMAELNEHVRVLQRFELANAHAEWFSAYGHLYRPATAAAVREGQAVTPDAYDTSAAWRSRFISRLSSAAHDHGIDAWVTPAAPGLPPLGLSSTGSAVMSAPFSLAGSPAVCIPTAPPQRGLFHALQLAGLPRDDATVLQIAIEVERTFR